MKIEDWKNREVRVVFKEIPPDLNPHAHTYHGTMLSRDGDMVLFRFPTVRAQIWVNLWSTSSITLRDS